ncbi:hypothetical protein [Clostridioides sp. ES-S-0048-02]|nr:hypothetical protein [Clostridioides sp. ES-S-0048-02]
MKKSDLITIVSIIITIVSIFLTLIGGNNLYKKNVVNINNCVNCKIIDND